MPFGSERFVRRGQQPRYIDQYDQPLPVMSEETIARLAGLDVPQEEDFDLPEQSYDPGILGRLAEGLQGFEAPRNPTSVGEGFLYGLVGGLGQQGSRVARAREKLDIAQSRRQQELDQARRQATRDYRQERSRFLLQSSKEQRAERTKKQEYEQENPLVDDALIAAYPGLSALPRMKGRRVNIEMLQREAIQEPARTAAAGRANAAADRAAEAATRAAAAQERQERLSRVQTVNQLADDYRVDPSIKSFTNVASNIKTAEVASKQHNGVGDVALIFSYMRALEPDNPNVVREGDFKVARLAAGQLQAFRTLPTRFFRGDLLTEEGRQHFLRQMNQSLEARRPDYDLANAQYRRRAEAGGVDPELFIRQPSGTRPTLNSFWSP